MAPRHEAWLVDLDGTLYHPLPVKAAMAAELVLAGRRRIQILRSFRRAHEALREEEVTAARGDSPYESQLQRAAETCGRSIDEVRAEVGEWMQRRPGKWLRLFRRRALLRCVATFRGLGGKTALVSDYPARIKLRSMQIEHLFDVVIASGEPGEAGCLKPLPGGFQKAARELMVPADRCLVIGDREDADGEAARRAGMDYHPVQAPRAALAPDLAH